MVETVTQHYHWTKPEVTKSASTWGGFLNGDLDAIDAQVFANQSLFANYLPLTGGTITGNLSVSGTLSGTAGAFGNISTASITASGNITATGNVISNATVQGATVNATGNVNAVSVVASNTVQGAYINSTGRVNASGDIVASGNVGGNAINAGPGGFSTPGAIVATNGVNGGTGGFVTSGNVDSNSIGTNQLVSRGTTYFNYNTYNDFYTVVGTGNNSRGIQFANGWVIQAIANNLAYYFGIGGKNVGWLDYVGNFTIIGQGYKPGGGGWAASSDKRVKRDIKPYQSGLKELSRLEPVSYAYNGKGGTQDTGKRYVGLTAQAAQQAMPSLVHKMPGKFDGKLEGQLAVDSSELIYTLVNAVKELAAELAALKAKTP